MQISRLIAAMYKNIIYFRFLQMLYAGNSIKFMVTFI
jgi:hypothetical protein